MFVGIEWVGYWIVLILAWYWIWLKASIYCLNTRLMLSRKTEPESRRPGTFVCAKCALYFVTSLSFGGGLAVVVFIPCLVEFAWLCYSVCLFSPSFYVVLESLSSLLSSFLGSRCLLTAQQSFEEHCTEILMGAAREKKHQVKTQLDELGGLFMSDQGLALDLEMKATLTWPGCGCETIGPLREQTISSCARAVFLGGPCEGKTDEIWEHWTLSGYDLPGLH